LAAKWCVPQGTFEPTICPEGSYCPVPGKLLIKCPSGNFCPYGSYKPVECPWLSLCPEGSAEPRHIGAILVVFLVDIVIIAICALYYYYRKYKHQKHFSIVSDTNEDDGTQNNDPDIAEAAPARTATQVLIEGFNLSRGDQPLLDFDFSEMGLSIPGGKRILHGVTGSIKHGQVTAVMGPSGAGKTTFLNTLMGKVDRNWKTEGSLQVNGEEAKGLSKLKKLVGYVPQEDVMHRELSVWQNLRYSADIRLPRDWDHDRRQRHVNAILDVLELSHVRNSPIGDETTRGVSGGQRKRVNIGMELAACPMALFCDEPTSGLDSSSSLSVVTAVKRVARTTGMTVVMVIHQPRVEIWNSLDRVLILAPGGITAFLGEQRFAQKYFEHHFGVVFKRVDNPADVIMDHIAEHGTECAKLWKDSGESWLIEHAAKHASGDSEFDDELAESSMSQLRASKVIEREEKRRHKKRDGSLAGSSNSIEMTEAAEVPDTIPSSPKSATRAMAQSSEFIEEYRSNADDKIVRGASFLWQFWYAFVRAMKQQYMGLGSFALEMALAILAGAVIGFSAQMHYRGVAIIPYTTLTPSPEITIVPQKALYICMAVGIAAASAGVKVFGEEMVIFWREASAGHNRLAYYLGVSLAVIPRIILGGIHFTGFYQVLSCGYTPYPTMLMNVILIFFAVYGLSSVVSMLVPRRDAPLLAAVICVIASVLNGYVRSLPLPVCYLSYAYWSTDSYFTSEIMYAEHVIDTSITAKLFRFEPHRISMDFGLMFSIGVIYRIIGFILLVFLNRDKQR
jgi:ABC-type multidrug transport system ATPase subunit